MTSKIASTDLILKTLQGARNLIEKKGWIQNQGATEHGHCLVNALSHALWMGAGIRGEGEPEWLELTSLILDVVGVTRHDRTAFPLGTVGISFPLVMWNDHEYRTKGQVLRALDDAIAKRLMLLGVLVVAPTDVADHSGLVESVAGQ